MSSLHGTNASSLLRQVAQRQRLRNPPKTPTRSKVTQSLHENVIRSTPYSMSSQSTLLHGHVNCSETEKFLLVELNLPGARHELTKENLDEFLQNNTANDANAFVLHSPVDSWNIPAKPTSESALYEPLVSLFNNILKFFHIHDEQGRRVLNNSKRRLTHVEVYTEVAAKETIVVQSSPDIRIVGLGNHFRCYLPIDSADYRRVVSPVEVKTRANQQGESKFLAQCAVYARQCFIQQKGRRFVFVPLLNEDSVRLYLFDRGGVIISPWVNYRQQPNVLVQVVLLCSGGRIASESRVESPAKAFTWERDIALGLNPSITWEDDTQIITVNAKKYRVLSDVFGSRAIRGRGTSVWRVVDGDNQRRIIKYLWRADGRTPEWELLAKVKDVPGVANLVDYQVEPSLFALRPKVGDNQYPCIDRDASFLVLEEYGENITKFRTPLHFLNAFRDAITGHYKMWERGVLHRDISINNILYGLDDDKEGSRGVVIDMDLAIEFDRTTCLCSADWLTGTRAFQSYHILSSEDLATNGKFVPVHDYLDDLESFLWVFIWVTKAYKVTPSGSVALETLPDDLLVFQSDPKSALGVKLNYMSFPDKFTLDESWPPQLNVLRTELLTFFRHFALNVKWRKKARPTLDTLSVPSRYHYDLFLGYIDQAISDLKSNTIRDVDDLDFDFPAHDRIIAKMQAERMVNQPTLVASTVHAPIPPSPSTPPPRTRSQFQTPRTPTQRGDLYGSGSPFPLTPSQVDNVGTRSKRALDDDDGSTKRFKTPTGSISSPFASRQPRTP